MALRHTLVMLACLVLARPALAADEAPGQVMPSPFDGLVHNFANSFIGINFGFHVAAVAASASMSSQDVDVRVHRYFHDHPGLGRDAYPAIIVGVAGPVALFGGLHVVGRLTRDAETVGAAYAVFQAGALTLGYVTLLKLVTGRPAPRDEYIPSVAPDDAALSREFRPGIYRGGVVAGWPSGHTAITTAMLTSLAAYYPDSVLLKMAAVVGSAGMMFAVSSFAAGGMHWSSDAVAGALFAIPIGLSTGKGMREAVRGAKPGPTRSAWFVGPSLRPDLTGATLGRAF